MKSYKVIKIINNSAIIALDVNKEVILLGKGIGFQRKEGDIISKTAQIEKAFQRIDAKITGSGTVDNNMLPFIATVIELMDQYTDNDFRIPL